ncbi:MAG: HAD family phosphatase [Verrucomicrobia bacterium]|nr:HAD family phosphatase [Verrucomicrobiota bacterium]
MRAKFKAIIFDMDGVIVDSEPWHEHAFREVFAELGYGETHGIHFPDYFGRSDRTLWVDFIAKHQPPHSLEELTALKQNRTVKLLREKQPIYAGLPELVGKCAARYQLAVASGSTHPVIKEVLSLKNLRRFFTAVVSSDDVAHGKPAPDIFLRAAELLAVAPDECCVIEDSRAGVEAALAAGMTVIAITNSLPADKLARATRVVHSNAEIEACLL